MTSNLTNVQGSLFFSSYVLDAELGLSAHMLWRSDGTAAGTQIIKSIPTNGSGTALRYFTALNEKLFFIFTRDDRQKELWASDGSESGTMKMMNLDPINSPLFYAPGFHSSLTPIGNTLYFVANDIRHGVELWQTNGTLSGTSLVTDLNQRNSDAHPEAVASANGKLFALHTDFINSDLWASDGTRDGTVLLKRVPRGYGGGWAISSLKTIGNSLFFIVNSIELWKSDGTVAGTVLVQAIVENPYLYSKSIDINGIFYYVGPRQKLWKSDGTQAGTMPVHQQDLYMSIDNLTRVNSMLFFLGSENVHGVELWRSDGTEAGTRIVKDIVPGQNGSYPSWFTDVQGSLFFVASDTSGPGLWKSDGTEAGTVMVKAVSSNGLPSAPFKLFNANGTLFFICKIDDNHYQLWKSDGTTAGTVFVQTIDLTGTAFFQMAAIQNTLFFTSNDAEHGVELWKTDGTTDGTQIVKDIAPAAASSNPDSLINVNGTLFFSAEDPVHGRELWQSDGSQAGTMLVQDINPGPAGSNPRPAKELDGTLFFYADDGVHGFELWKTSDAVSPIRILGQGQTITPGSSTPDSSNGTNFGNISIGRKSSTSFRITNMSDSPITFTGNPTIIISGAAANDFSTSQPAITALTTLAPGQSLSLQ